MKNYFNYLFKNVFLETLIILIVVLLINTFFIYISQPAYAFFDSDLNSWIYSVPIVIPGIMMITSTVGVIVISLLKAFKLKSKSYTDMIYALPISRRKLISTHLIIGLIQVAIIFTISFVGSILTFYVLSNQAFRMEFVWLIYPVFLTFILILYGLFQFIIYRANNIADAVSLITVYLIFTFIVVLVGQSTKYYFGTFYNEFDEYMIFPFYSMDKISMLLLKNATPNATHSFETHLLSTSQLISVIVNGIVYLTLSVSGFIYTIFKFKTDKTEVIGDVTTSKFGYKVLNPLIVFFSTFLLLFSALVNSTFNTIILLPVIIIIFYVMYAIYRRKFKIPYVDYIVLASTMFTAILINIVLFNILF